MPNLSYPHTFIRHIRTRVLEDYSTYTKLVLIMIGLTMVLILMLLMSACVSDFSSAEDSKNINAGRDVTKEPGHLKRFGDGRPSYPVDEIRGFLPPKQFMEEYVFPQRPVIFRGAAGLSRALDFWTDEYFLSLDIPEDNTVVVETKKKENRTQPATDLHFQKFITVYNITDQYMVNDVPEFLLGDLLLPCSIQCPAMHPLLVAAMMWISSGGTKSVVHTDAVENINCIFRGDKEFVMVDPERYFDKVDLDRPEASYSDMDVDHVDFTLYPGLADVEYFHVNVSAGDCLYIPFRWIHQVRSHGSNIAVNVWWDHYMMSSVNAGSCSPTCDTDLTLDKVKFLGFDSTINSPYVIKDHVLALIGINAHILLDRFMNVFLEELLFEQDTEQAIESKSLLKQIFDILDSDTDGKVTPNEVKEANMEVLTKAMNILKTLEEMAKTYQAEVMASEEEFDESMDLDDHDIEDGVVIKVSANKKDVVKERHIHDESTIKEEL